MSTFGRVLRRFYATSPPKPPPSPPRFVAGSALPPHAAAAREASTPLAVRERRQNKSPEFLPPSDSPLTPTEYSTYRRQLAKGELRIDGRDMTEAEWLDKLNAKRSRIRGIQKVRSNTGDTETRIVGQKIFLPNIIFKMVRNHTPLGKLYNPYEATFRVPQSITKTDIRSYLWTVYGVKTTYIRTANYIAPLRRSPMGMRPGRRTYKRTVVGLVDPFYYPQDMKRMSRRERKEREKWLEEKFSIKAAKEQMLEILTRQGGGVSKTWRLTGHLRRDKILLSIAKRRILVSRELAQVEAEVAAQREAGKPVLSEKGFAKPPTPKLKIKAKTRSKGKVQVTGQDKAKQVLTV